MSLKNDLMSRGYVEIGTRGKCKYYVRCKQCYKDYLEVSVDDVERAGFTERYPKRKSGATYYVRDTCEYALARTKNGIFVVLDKETYESVKDISI